MSERYEITIRPGYYPPLVEGEKKFEVVPAYQLDEALARAEKAERKRDESRYIGVPCPVCGRLRLEYEPGNQHNIECEKCGADRDQIYHANPVARIAELEGEVERLRLALGRLRAGKPESGEANPDE